MGGLPITYTGSRVFWPGQISWLKRMAVLSGARLSDVHCKSGFIHSSISDHIFIPCVVVRKHTLQPDTTTGGLFSPVSSLIADAAPRYVSFMARVRNSFIP